MELSSMYEIRDVAVIGAGVAGSSMAKALADKGWETVLLDRQSFPRHKVCGEFLSPESQVMLHELGLYPVVEELKPSLIHRTRLIAKGGNSLEIPLPGTGLGISRFSLDSALHAAAGRSSVDVQLATTVTSVKQNAKGYLVETRQGEGAKSYQVRAVIAAWGAHPNARLAGRPSGTFTMGSYMGVKSHFVGIDMEPIVELYFFPGGYLGISPIEGGRVNVAALLSKSAFRESEKTILGLLQAAVGRNPKLYKRLSKATPIPGSQVAVAPVRILQKPLAWQLFPYAGDAVVTIPPLCGDGMSMALRSAQICCVLGDRYLHGDISLACWELEYKRELERQFRGPLRWGRLLQLLFGIPMFPETLLSMGQITPGIAFRLLQSTRLQGTDS
jgi:flavin-dependent dehydrogenase